jgi:tubby and related proteins
VRHKSGFNRLWPKYTLHLSDGNKFLLVGKKRSGNATSNYMISLDQDKMKKGVTGYLGKLRSNFLGTEFYLYDSGENPKKAKNYESVRAQHGVVEYEKNVLGSKGPRRMKVLLPKVSRDGSIVEFKSTDVSNPISNVLEKLFNREYVQGW